MGMTVCPCPAPATQQYIPAVEYLHAHHVAHRDLKLDNIVLDGSMPPRIKVCDFGFAKNWDEESKMFTQVRCRAGRDSRGLGGVQPSLETACPQRLS